MAKRNMAELGIATRWKPGQSGNPQGINQYSPGVMLRQSAREMFGPDLEKARDVLVELAQDKEVPPHVRLAAAALIVERACGKPRLEADADPQSTDDDSEWKSDEELEALEGYKGNGGHNGNGTDH